MCKGGYTTHQLSCSTPLLKLGPLPYHPESVLVRCSFISVACTFTAVWCFESVLNLCPQTTVTRVSRHERTTCVVWRTGTQRYKKRHACLKLYTADRRARTARRRRARGVFRARFVYEHNPPHLNVNLKKPESLPTTTLTTWSEFGHRGVLRFAARSDQ